MTMFVAEWSPRDACRLQRAMRMTNEAFAERLGAAPRTVAKWHAKPGMRLTLEMQQALDTMLARAGADVQGRFLALEPTPNARDKPRREPWRRRLEGDRNLAAALDWLDGIRRECPGTSRRDVEELLSDGGARRVEEVARARGTVDREVAAELVRDFYGLAGDGYATLTITAAGRDHRTTMLANRRLLHGALDLRQQGGAFELQHGVPPPPVPCTAKLTESAVQRLAEVLVARTRFVEAPVYRLVTPPSTDGATSATFAIDSFARYALTWDVLEAEVADAVLGSTKTLTLREHLLPNVESVVRPEGRICVGGAQALCALARPGPRDYLLLVQERSPRVVNATGRLAVIPKCFHQPINDPAGDVTIGRTLLREIEEELFGRVELDTGGTAESSADALHPSRLSAPMRWLARSEDWVLQQTGFGFNLMSGNYEYASLLAVHDERFWAEHGGAIEANWEAARLRTISSLDRDGLATLLNEPGWSDEGLVAFSLGLKRLAELAPGRVSLPPLEIGLDA